MHHNGLMRPLDESFAIDHDLMRPVSKMPAIRAIAILFAMLAIETSAMGQLIIAHRGASHDAPENSLSAFKLAIEQDADGFEADFYLTSDGKIACFHDKDTERISGKKLLVVKTPLAKLQSLDVGSWKGPRWKGEKMPVMEEVLAAVPAGKKIFIELKSSVEVVNPMAKAIEASPLEPEQIVIISFHADAIAECKKQLPHLKALWLCGYKEQKDGSFTPGVEEVAATLKRIHADGFNSEARAEHFDEAFINRLRELGCSEFSVWTVDDPKDAEYYARLGAWAITTNRPGWLREKLLAVSR
jgi:glycerophosphoryl diester phosphodiesterase